MQINTGNYRKVFTVQTSCSGSDAFSGTSGAPLSSCWTNTTSTANAPNGLPYVVMAQLGNGGGVEASNFSSLRFGYLTTSILLSWGFYLVVEQPFMKLRRRAGTGIVTLQQKEISEVEALQ